jgi:hypothetical protein
MKKKFKYIYALIFIFILTISSIGATYAYFAASTGSSEKVINTSSESYDISMNITPVYEGFTTIPMDNEDALTAVKNKCKDKYDRGACFAYNINVNGYDDNLGYISGIMNVSTNNIENLSYMVMEEYGDYNETGDDVDNCAVIEEKSYCISKEATNVVLNTDISLGEKYNIIGTTEKNLLLVIWLSNLEESQNENDVGDFNATVTFSMGNGGEIKGNILASVSENKEVGNADEE